MLLLNDLDRAHHVRRTVEADPDLPEGSLAENAPDLVPLPDVVDLLEAAEIFKADDVLISLF